MRGNGVSISTAQALSPDGGERPLDQLEQELAIGERHLHVELRDLLDAVGTQILVAEADRDLVVAVEAGHHRELLQDLRALREREEPALCRRLGTTKSRAPSVSA
jgi:hypothetical protein